MKEKRKYPLGGMICRHHTVRETPEGYEAVLRSLWASLPENAVLSLEGGGTCVVLSPGQENFGPGPDFLGAKLRMGRKVKEGDVAIHCRVSDFIRHRHVSDPAYEHVILQAAKLNDLKSAPPRQMAKLPILLLDEEMIRLLREEKEETVSEKKRPCGPVPETPEFVPSPCPLCPSPELSPRKKHTEEKKNVCAAAPCLAGLTETEQKWFFLSAAKDRMNEKAEKVLRKLISSGTEEAFKEELFLFAGYPGNKEAFSALFVTFSHYPAEARKKDFRGILWGESGLLPDPASTDLSGESASLAKELWTQFWASRTGSKRNPVWSRSGALFGNTPERRLAMLCLLLEKLSFDPLPFLAEKLCREGAELFLENMERSLELRDPFWECRSSFFSPADGRKRTLFSPSRRITFLTDVLVPALLAYARLNKDPLLLRGTEKLFLLLPSPEENAQIRQAAHLWYEGAVLPDSSAVFQGWLHIYRNYCKRLSHDCGSCVLADSRTVP